MKSKGNRINNQKDNGLRRKTNPNSILHIKSANNLRIFNQPHGEGIKSQVQNKESEYNTPLESLKLSRSNPNIITISNNYIKLDTINVRNYQQLFNKFHTSVPKETKQYKNNPLERILTIKKKESVLVQKHLTDLTAKKPKFMRKNVETKQESIPSPPASCNLFANQQDSIQSMGDLIQQSNMLKRKIFDCEAKIQQLTLKIKEKDAKLANKNKEVEELKKRLQVSEEEKSQITKKLQDMISEQEVFKGGACHFNLDDSEIAGDMVSTAEYIESLTDLEEELHRRKTEIFDLNKTVEQLKMKHHFSELRNEENLRRLNSQWENKYKKLVNMYKTLKASRNEGNKMKKLKTKTEYIEYEKEELFDLSISTEQSQLPLF